MKLEHQRIADSIFCFCIGMLISIAHANAATLKAALPLSRVATTTVHDKRVTCALFRGRSKWVVAKRVTGSVYRHITGTPAQRAACLQVGNLRTVSLQNLPDTDRLVGENTQAQAARISSVSGTPPALPDIPDLGVSLLFWRPGVINRLRTGHATLADCQEFFNSPVDGFSGGMNSCHLTQGVGYSFQTILSSGVDLCFMKHAPTQANLDAGGISLVHGHFPDNDVTQLFAVPSDSPKVVRVDLPGKIFFIKIYDAATNSHQGDIYRFETWSCKGQPLPIQYSSTRVTADGRFITTMNHSDHGVNSFVVTAYLRREGSSFLFDNSKSRSATILFHAEDDSSHFKSVLTIDAENIIRNKVHEVRASDERKAYSVTRISGASVAELRFLEGAYKERHLRNDVEDFLFSSGTEYRDTLYAAAPNGDLMNDLDEVDPGTDSFYSAIEAVDFDASPYSCSDLGDIEVLLDPTNGNILPISTACNGVRLQRMDFCSTDTDVQGALAGFQSQCIH